MTILIPRKKGFWRRKPSTPQELNRGHPLAAGLWLYTLEEGGRPTCLMGVALDPQSNISYGVGQEGIYSTGSGVNDANSAIIMEQPPTDDWSGVSCLSLFDWKGVLSSTWPSLIISASSGGYYGNFNLAVNRDGSKIEWRAGYSASRAEASLSGVATGDLIFAAGTWDKTTLKSYSAINNGDLATGSTAQTNNFTGTTPDNFLNHGGFSGNRTCDFPVYLRAVWGRTLSILELESLKEAPYQILKPRKSYFFVPEAGAPATFEPVWARKTNTLIGGGLNV